MDLVNVGLAQRGRCAPCQAPWRRLHGVPSDFELNFGSYLPGLGRARAVMTGIRSS